MSALERITDSTRTSRHVRKVPKADMRYRSQLRGINSRNFSIKRAPIIPAFAPAASITSNRPGGQPSRDGTARITNLGTVFMVRAEQSIR
jgi:hypothetical protein